MDIGISTINMLKLTSILIKQQKKAEILVFSSAEYKTYALKYFKLGVSGFLDKSSSEKELLMAITMITSGHLYLPKDVLMSIYNANVNTETDDNATPFNCLSERELEVFKLLIKGKRVKDISKIMKIHQSTISALKRRIFQKFKVDNLMNLKSMAMEYGY